jgi:hypothetical protein
VPLVPVVEFATLMPVVAEFVLLEEVLIGVPDGAVNPAGELVPPP